MAKHLYTNRLIYQKSPYLLQHAHNPVDWYPWGDEAFKAAQDLDRPIFLSIGYATCHWCHVMEKESFENLEIGHLLNDTFINIKIDREELPHIDNLYMEFAQSMMAGAAGWPLNVILTPELKPFFAATYLPPHSSHGMMGLAELVKRIREVWQGEERERVIAQASQIVDVFAENIHVEGSDLPEKQQVEEVLNLLFKMSDPAHGGIKGVPKFPIGYQYNFLLRAYRTLKDSRALFMAERTLDMMQRGGIYDHLGGGFSRYSVDENWLVPHFEKMLYDNAFLICSYLEAWQVTKKEFYRQVCVEIVRYILRDMSHPEGGFFSAEDADSEGGEGLFYTWTLEEIQKLLGKEESSDLCDFYAVTPSGNFDGRNILHTPLRLEEFAARNQMDPQMLKEKFDIQKQILWKDRLQRPRPLKDDKILSSWNGLMIHSLVNAGCAFNEPSYIQAAIKSAKFIRQNLREDGYLLRRWREGEAQYSAGLDEYAFLIRGLISMFEADCGTEWLEWALEMSRILYQDFKAEDGAFYQTDGKDSNLLLRKAAFSDGAEPSGNAIHCENLLRLYQLSQNPSYLDQAEDVLRAVKIFIDSYSPGYCYHEMNINRYYDRHAPTFVVALNDKEEFKTNLMQEIYSHFIPHKAVIWRRENAKNLFEILPFVQEQECIDGKTTLYICHQGTCQKPLITLDEMIDGISKV
jgi:uncharacterized protein YyaL (SSP411 family)